MGCSMNSRIVGLAMLALASLGERLHAQSGNNAQILRAVLDTLQLGSRDAIVVSSAKRCRPEFNKFRADVDCREGRLTASGRSKALNSAREFASAIGASFQDDGGQAVRLRQTPPNDRKIEFCADPGELVWLVMPGPLQEVEARHRWRITMTYAMYPKRFECEGEVYVTGDMSRAGAATHDKAELGYPGFGFCRPAHRHTRLLAQHPQHGVHERAAVRRQRAARRELIHQFGQQRREPVLRLRR